VVLAQRLRWRGIPAEVIDITVGEAVPTSCHIYLTGGGEDGPQALAVRELPGIERVHAEPDAERIENAVARAIARRDVARPVGHDLFVSKRHPAPVSTSYGCGSNA
jgi:hypothetical protein